MKTLNPERRGNQRFTLRPDVSRVVVHCDKVPFEGHAYDISNCGIRLELDEALQVGKRIDIDLYTTGTFKEIRFSGVVTRIFDEIDDPGPRRMGIEITKFTDKEDEKRLITLLKGGSNGRLR
ncbi:MAG: PilZ domain-containing protein [Planctomycetes bacterium]|nr:PilZ domain-containing protein [Planctomycetota bacterium]